MAAPGAPPDPLRDRRAHIARWVRRAMLLGYAALLVAIACFAAALLTDFAAVPVRLTIGSLVAACVILPVPIVLGYGIRAAERDDRRQGYR